MMRSGLWFALFVFSVLFLTAQSGSLLVMADTIPGIDTGTSNVDIRRAIHQPVYKLKPPRDVPVFFAGAGWSGYAFTQIYSKDRSSEAKILSLDRNDINGFDRWGVRPYSESVGDKSNYIFYGSMPLPFLFLACKDTRKDFFKLTFMYLEAMSVTGLLYTGSVYLTNRFRPYAYSSETPMAWRTRGGAKNSFYAGHVALIATSTFFMAKVFADYYPDSKIKWLMFGMAGGATATMAYLRHRGGFHFPSDILLGIAQGTLTGFLVPHFHKNKLIKDQVLACCLIVMDEPADFL
jgi:hypothetical protein